MILGPDYRLTVAMHAHIQDALSAARLALRDGKPAAAVRVLADICALHPNNAQLVKSLGAALFANGELPAARMAFERAIALNPELATAHLHLAQVLNAQGERDLATRAYFRAVSRAQMRGDWRSAQTTPAHLHTQVLQAMDQIEQDRPRLLGMLLAPLIEAYGLGELKRVSAALAGYLQRTRLQSGDARQHARFMHVPGLREQPFFDALEFPWTQALAAQSSLICAEAQAHLETRAGLEPFLRFDSPEQIDGFLHSSQADQAPQWDAYFFYRNGERFDAHHSACPATSNALEAAPLVRISAHAPEICFSVLSPGTHILPHTGVTNARLVVHLPLIVPDGCALRVGGEEHVWRSGECVVFDDTYEHEAWNRGSSARVILLMDAWHPDLSAAERLALSTLIKGIGEFNRA